MHISHCMGAPMSRGNSGRIVIEIEPDLKNELYQALTKEGVSLKGWFLQNVQSFLANKDQLALGLEIKEQERGVTHEAQ